MAVKDRKIRTNFFVQAHVLLGLFVLFPNKKVKELPNREVESRFLKGKGEELGMGMIVGQVMGLVTSIPQ